MELSRRSVLLLGTAAAIAQASIPATAKPSRSPQRAVDPVLFWNGVCLDLIALDHSIDLTDARAPGPCASARALGLAHAVIADAVYFAYQAPFKPQIYHGHPDIQIEVPELFVGGAAFGILGHIFNTSMHAYTISLNSERFRSLVGAYSSKDWQAGVAFASAIRFRDHWSWDRMQVSLLPQHSTYIPRPRRHNVDPYNAGQGYYGTEWGNYRPLILEGSRVIETLGPGEPPPEGSPEYERDLAEVRVKGALRSKSDRHFAARTRHETNVGLFWAYDGARLIGTPPRLYNQILRQIAISDGFDVVEMARLFALCNLAMADAGIVAWSAKYRYNVWRPVLGIQNHSRAPALKWLPLGSPKTNPVRNVQAGGFAPHPTAQALMGGGPMRPHQLAEEEKNPGLRQVRKSAGPLYRDAAFTPNFPAYPSGHATFGGAFFTMLELVRAERPLTRRNPGAIDIEFVSDELNGTSIDHGLDDTRPFYPIRYKSIDDLIKGNDLSRVYLGVHWRFDCERGSESGTRIARAIYDAAYHRNGKSDRQGS
jgi:membrane-associated phospholipid phosphatase